MSALTGNELIENVKGHLGDRESGKIGTLAIDEAVRRALNRGILYLGKKYNLPDLNRLITISVTTFDTSYALPTRQSSEDFKIKPASIQSIMSLKNGEDREYPLTLIDRRTLRKIYGNTDSTLATGRLIFAALSGRNLEVHPYPDDLYTLTLDCYIFSTGFTGSSLVNAHALGEEWDDVLEYFATYDIWAGLQQTTDADMWYARFKVAELETWSALELDTDLWTPNRGEIPGLGRGIFYDDAVASLHLNYSPLP